MTGVEEETSITDPIGGYADREEIQLIGKNGEDWVIFVWWISVRMERVVEEGTRVCGYQLHFSLRSRSTSLFHL